MQATVNPLATLCRYFPDGDYSVLVIHSVDERPVSSIQCNNIRICRSPIFFSVQVFPVILLFVIILSVVPAEYMSGRYRPCPKAVTAASLQVVRNSALAALVTLQFMISIGLLSAL